MIYISPRVGGFGRTLPLSRTPYRPVVITGLGTTPLLLNLGDESHDLEWLLRRLGQSMEVLGHNQFAAVCPQFQRLMSNDLLRPNTIVHFPPETVNNEGVTRALQAGLVFERPMLIEANAEAAARFLRHRHRRFDLSRPPRFATPHQVTLRPPSCRSPMRPVFCYPVLWMPRLNRRDQRLPLMNLCVCLDSKIRMTSQILSTFLP